MFSFSPSGAPSLSMRLICAKLLFPSIRQQPRPWQRKPGLSWEVSVKIRKPLFSLVICLAVVSFIGSAALADTVKLRDGSVLKGKVVSYTQGKFTIEVSIGGAISQHVVPVEEVESVEFDSIDGGAISRSEPMRASQPPASPSRSRIPRDNAPEVATSD